MIQGSGFTVDGAKNGCVLLYSADEAAGPWQYEGIIASGDGKHGRVWECPALVQVWGTMCFVEGAPASIWQLLIPSTLEPCIPIPVFVGLCMGIGTELCCRCVSS